MATNTKTLLTVKIDKTLKASAQKTAEQIGIPLGTLVNSMLKQMVLRQEVSFSILQPSKSLVRSLKEYKKDKNSGKTIVSDSVEEFIARLNS